MATTSRGIGFGLVVLCLIALGAVLYFAINQVSSEMPAGPATAKAATLHAAAEKGDIAGINAQLKNHVPVDQPRDSAGVRKGETPLMAAAYSSQAAAIRELLKNGAQANARASDGKTALMFAAGWGNLDSVRALLDSSARPNDRSEERLTALMLAAGRGQADCLQALLDAGAEVNAKNKWGQTALMLAARTGDAAKVKALLAASAAVNDTDLDGMSALNFAAGAEEAMATLEALVAAKADVAGADSEGVTPLMRAADKGDSDKVSLLLKAGANATIADKQGRKALDWAKARSDPAGDAVAKLLE
jgi:ankyrin repeat protein